MICTYSFTIDCFWFSAIFNKIISNSNFLLFLVLLFNNIRDYGISFFNANFLNKIISIDCLSPVVITLLQDVSNKVGEIKVSKDKWMDINKL